MKKTTHSQRMEQKLVPVSKLVDYLHAVRGFGQRKGESLLDAVVAALIQQHGMERGKINARRFVERYRQLILEKVKAAPPAQQRQQQARVSAAESEAKREPRPMDDAFAASAEFLNTYEWKRVRMQALKKYGPKCQCCGATPADGAVMNVDHIKPRRLFPELALDINNLQVLCGDCNHGKGYWDMTDWRCASDLKDDG